VLHRLREIVVVPPLPTSAQGKRRLKRNRARAASSPEALPSIACANQEIFLGLVIAGSAGLALAFPAALGMVAVLLITALPYDPAVHAYPSGGDRGSWRVPTRAWALPPRRFSNVSGRPARPLTAG
jgi:hypothetical protein